MDRLPPHLSEEITLTISVPYIITADLSVARMPSAIGCFNQNHLIIRSHRVLVDKKKAIRIDQNRDINQKYVGLRQYGQVFEKFTNNAKFVRVQSHYTVYKRQHQYPLNTILE